MAHHTAQQAPQDIAPAEIGGGDTVADQLGDGAAVVGDHLETGLALALEGAVIHGCQGGGGFDQWVDEIGFVVVGNGLQDLGHALQPHAGVDVAIGQGRERAAGVAVVLHEHEVVELDEATVVLKVDGVVAELRLEVVVNLRTGTAGAGGTGGPEVVGLIHAHDALRIHPHQIAPDGSRLVVLAEHTHHQVPGIEAEHHGAQLPGPLNRLTLEVIAEREIAEHLEERVMPRRAAHVFDVVGADALLAAGGPRRRPRRLAQKHRLERQHAGDRQQHRRVFRHQRGTGHALMAALLIEVEKGRADFSAGTGAGRGGGGHGNNVLRVRTHDYAGAGGETRNNARDSIKVMGINTELPT